MCIAIKNKYRVKSIRNIIKINSNKINRNHPRALHYEPLFVRLTEQHNTTTTTKKSKKD